MLALSYSGYFLTFFWPDTTLFIFLTAEYLYDGVKEVHEVCNEV